MGTRSILHPPSSARKRGFRKPAPFSPPLGLELREAWPRGNRCPLGPSLGSLRAASLSLSILYRQPGSPAPPPHFLPGSPPYLSLSCRAPVGSSAKVLCTFWTYLITMANGVPRWAWPLGWFRHRGTEESGESG